MAPKNTSLNQDRARGFRFSSLSSVPGCLDGRQAREQSNAVPPLKKYTSLAAFLLFALCPWLSAPALAGDNEQYIPAYNELIRMAWDRCLVAGDSTNGLCLKDATSTNETENSVTQSDLNNLRTNIIHLITSHFVVSTNLFDLSTNNVEAAFPYGLSYDASGNYRTNSLMAGIGSNGRFTAVPAEYTSDNAAVFTNDFSDVPVLWIHLYEMQQALIEMKYTRCAGTWTADGETNYAFGYMGDYDPDVAKMLAEALYDTYGYSVEGTAPYADSFWGWAYEAGLTRVAACYSVTGISTSQPHSAYFYNYAIAGESWESGGEFYANDDPVAMNTWVLWDVSVATNSASNLTTRVGSVTNRPAWGNYEEDFGYKVTAAQAILEWSNLFTTNIVNPAYRDNDADGLITLGSCESCAGLCEKGADVTWDKTWACTDAKYRLGISGGLTNGNLRVRAYVSDYQIDGQPYQMFSLDTRIVATNSDPGGKWEFVTVKRPSGAEVVLSMKGTNGCVSLPKMTYWMSSDAQGNYSLHFPDAEGETIHRFSSNSLSEVCKIGPGVSNSLSGGPAQWGDMTITREGEHLTLVHCTKFSSQPAYSGDLISSVKYLDKDGNEIHSGEIQVGSRRYVEKDSEGNVQKQTWVITPSTDCTEIWRGVTTNGVSTNVALKEIRSESFDASSLKITITEIRILNPGGPGEQSNVSVRIMQKFAWGADEIISETVGYGTAEAQTTLYTWYTNSVDTNNYGRLQLAQYPDGSWTAYEYDSQGRAITVRTPFGNAAPDAATNECRLTRYYYPGSVPAGLNFPAADIAVTNDQRPRLTIEEVCGTEVGRSYTASLSGSTVTKRCLTSGAAYDDGSNLVTTTWLNTSGTYLGRPSKIEHSDGTLTVYGYSYDGGATQLTTTVETGAPNEAGDDVTDGTRTISVEDAAGNIVSSSTEDILSEIPLSEMVYTRDAFGRATCASNLVSGLYSTTQYGCCGPENIVDEEGIETTQDYNELDQLFAVTRVGPTIFYEYGVGGQLVKTTVSTNNPIVTASAFDAANRLIATTNELGYATTYAYGTNAFGGKVVTTTNPDGSTRIETYYRDGQLASVSGTSVHPSCYAYGIEDGMQVTTEYRGSDTNATEWTKSYRDLLGRTVKAVQPGYTNVISYNSLGQQESSSDGFTISLTAYDDKGEPFQSAVDMNGNGAIDTNGTDRISENQTYYTDDGNLRVSVSKVYPTNGSSSTLTLSSSLSALAGDESWTISFGRTNHLSVSRDRATASRMETVTRPDGTQSVSTYTNGLLSSVVEKDSLGTTLATRTMSYDAFNRLQTTTEPAANGETRTTTVQYNPAGVATSITASAGSLSQTTSYEMDCMGRRVQTILSDNGVVNYGYNSYGELTLQDGARTYPVGYTYTDQGRMTTLSTYRDGTNSSADVTTWNYDSQRGWLTSKVYADSSSVSYSYFGDGALSTRTWARGNETSYSYDKAGSLTNVDYSDSTADISYTLDRLGRAVTVSDGIGTWTNSYAEDGSLASSSLPQLSGGSLAYGRDVLGRLTNMSLQMGGQRVQNTVYGFDEAGRLSTAGDVTRTGTYDYGPDGATWTNLSFGSPLNISRTFDGLNRLSEISSVPSASSVVSFSYSYNQANQRTTNSLADGGKWIYQYDSLGQITSGKKYFADGTAVQGAQFVYSFDSIGNRITGEAGTASAESEYTANELNQYTERTVPAEVLVTGSAVTGATVSVRLGTNNASLANRKGTYFWKSVDVANSADGFATTNLKVTATLPSGTQSLVRTEARSALVAQTPEAYVHDLDGNLVQDGTWTNAWDACNQLVSMESRAWLPDAQRKRLEFRYDFQGRRTEKKSLAGYSAGSWGTTNVTTYVWDNWLPIAEIGQSAVASGGGGNIAATNFFTWSLDLSGTLQGAGGVGGLLIADLGGTNAVFPVYDGNGNIMGLVDAESGAVVGEAEYGVFGETMRRTGLCNDLSFGFSTKPTDRESGKVAFQKRVYEPETGRWLSRDSIGELGGLLYGFVDNDALGGIDVSGLTRYEYDGQGLHVHDHGLSYTVDPQADGTTILAAKKGKKHEGEFDAEKAKIHYREILKDKKELKKLREAVKDYWDKCETMESKKRVADVGRNLRRASARARTTLSMLGVLGVALALDPNVTDAAELKQALSKIDMSLKGGGVPSEDDILTATLAVSNIYGSDIAAVFFGDLAKAGQNKNIGSTE